MEFDELKKAWGQFNDKINCQEVVERQQVEEMLAKKRIPREIRSYHNNRL